MRVRIYDREGQMVTEDCLRLQYPEKYDKDGRYSEEYLKEENAPDEIEPLKRPVVAEEGILEGRAIVMYVPYNENNYATRIVRLEGRKEIVIENLGSSYIEKSELTGELYDDSKYLKTRICL